MVNYYSVEELLFSSESLVQLVNNIGHDDDTMTFTGVDWFYFNGVVADKIYVNGNSWFGFGKSSEQLRVCRRDAKMWNFWREEGTLFHQYRFLRLKWDGFAHYSSTSTDLRLCYEVFLFETGDIFLNVLQAPRSSSYLGTSQLVCAGGTKSFSVATGGDTQVTFTHLDETGSNYDVSDGFNSIEPPYNRKFLVSDKEGKVYTSGSENGEQALVEIESVAELTAEIFETYGMDHLPSVFLLMPLINPSILYWQDSENGLPNIQMDVTALPPNQTVYTENFSMIDSTINGIENVTIDSDMNTLFAVSFDNGVSWYAYVNSEWSLLTEERSGISKTAFEEIGTDAWALIANTGQYMFRFILMEGSYVNNITVHYLN